MQVIVKLVIKAIDWSNYNTYLVVDTNELCFAKEVTNDVSNCEEIAHEIIQEVTDLPLEFLTFQLMEAIVHHDGVVCIHYNTEIPFDTKLKKGKFLLRSKRI